MRAGSNGQRPSEKEKNRPMAATLHEILLAPDVRPQVVADCNALIEDEVRSKSGISGTAVKLAYKTVTSFAPGYLNDTVRDLVPQMVGKLEPYWADFSTSGSSEFSDYLVKRGGEVSEALLSVTDDVATRSDKPVIIKAYRSVRGNAAKNVEAALPRLGELVVKYTG
jgi:hypothetical protein